jgi:hypothetical protein
MSQPEGGSGGPNAPGIRTTRLIERALRERWPIPKSLRKPLIERLAEIVQGTGSSPREVTSAAKAILAASKINLEAIAATNRAREHEGLIRHLAAADLEAAHVAEPPAANDGRDVALDMELHLSEAQRTALAAIVRRQAVPDAARLARVSPGTLRRWLADDPLFIAATNAALSERDGRPRAELAALGPVAVAVLRAALHGCAGPATARAALDTIRLLKLNEPPPARATDPAAAEREVLWRMEDERLQDLATPLPPSWVNGEYDEDEEDDE